MTSIFQGSVFPNAKDLVSVQPMTIPSGKIFYLDYKYNSKTKRIKIKKKKVLTDPIEILMQKIGYDI